ncbi:MAG: glycosyltransferase family 4 protein [Actinomycetota bacterium]|nr:glycosyltransferase family 4 protein [Actinomycetota bacterium]
MLHQLNERLDDLRILISTEMEHNRAWPVQWGQLNVRVQRSFTIQRPWRHPHGFSEPVFIHVPYDTPWLLWRNRPDAVISTELGPRSLLAVLYGKLDRMCRVIVWVNVSEHTEKARGRLRPLLRRWLLRHSDAVLVGGESGARYLERFGVSPETVIRAPYTVVRPLEPPPARAAGDGTARLLYVGQLIERKGLLPFLDVLADWGRDHPDRDMQLRLAGDGPLRERLERAVMPPNVTLRFLGNVAYQDLPGLYAQADIFSFPSLADEWGVVVNEALAAGLPVLGSVYSQAVEELVEEGRTGWCFRPDEPDEAYAALDRALHTPPGELARMGAAGWVAVARLAPDVVADRIVEVVKEGGGARTGVGGGP